VKKTKSCSTCPVNNGSHYGSRSIVTKSNEVGTGQTGGEENPSIVPTIIKTRTAQGTPFISNMAKQTYAAKMTEEKGNLGSNEAKQSNVKKTEEKGTPITGSVSIQNPSTMQPTFEMKMFAPAQPPPRPIGIYPQYIPMVELANGKKFSPGDFSYLNLPTSAISYGPNVQIPMQQVYQINLPGPTGDHVEMKAIYETILPGKEGKMTATTMGERLQTYDYVRQLLIKINEGEDISIDSDEQSNLLSYIKFMELNPNYYSPINANPYSGLPFGLLIYRACFPIRYNEQNRTIMCARTSIGLNIRLYALSYAEYYSYKFRQVIYKEYDVWRELAFYEYVRENILKKKQSPNFPLLYAFFMSPNRKINFFALKKNCLSQKDQLTKEYQRFVEIHGLFTSVKPSTELIRPMTLPDAAKKIIAKLPDEIDPALQAYSGTTLILVTEAPNHNLYQWASRQYEYEGGLVRRMISHGYHDERVWLGVLFQIVAALYVMQNHGIYIRNMTIQDNIYIKDLQNYGKAMGYWKYIINGISYYLPNYGYVVFIDSNFKDIYPQGLTIERCKREYKIYGVIDERNPILDIKTKIYENFRTIINTNSFTKEYTQNNVTRPPESIMELIERMMQDNDIDLGYVIQKHFRQLMNNRIGTLLRKDSEIPNIREITGRFTYGEMAAEVIEADIFKWCLVIRQKDGAMVEIVTRENPNSTDFITKEVRIETLKQYSASEKIEQTNNPDINFSEEELLETYIISDNQ